MDSLPAHGSTSLSPPLASPAAPDPVAPAMAAMAAMELDIRHEGNGNGKVDGKLDAQELLEIGDNVFQDSSSTRHSLMDTPDILTKDLMLRIGGACKGVTHEAVLGFATEERPERRGGRAGAEAAADARLQARRERKARARKARKMRAKAKAKAEEEGTSAGDPGLNNDASESDEMELRSASSSQQE